MWMCESTKPGTTRRPAASMTAAPSVARFDATCATRPSAIPRSTRSGRLRSCAPRTTRSNAMACSSLRSVRAGEREPGKHGDDPEDPLRAEGDPWAAEQAEGADRAGRSELAQYGAGDRRHRARTWHGDNDARDDHFAQEAPGIRTAGTREASARSS